MSPNLASLAIGGFAGSPFGLLVVRPDGMITLANRAAHQTLGAEPKTLPGRSLRGALRSLPASMTCLPGSSPVEIDGSPHSVWGLSGRTGESSDWAPGHSALTAELAQARADLTFSRMELDRFAYVTAHDLQAPLRMIASFTTLLEEEFGDALSTDGREYLAFVHNGAKDVQRMVRGLLAYVRVQSRALPMTESEGDELVAQAIARVRPWLDEAKAQVVTQPLPRLWVDPRQTVEIFRQLLLNAVSWPGDGPPVISIDSEPSADGFAHIRVRDEGLGFDPRQAEKAFRIFARLGRTGPVDGSAGIGLSVVRRVVERHGGAIQITTAPGEGTTVHLTLPLAAGQPGELNE